VQLLADFIFAAAALARRLLVELHGEPVQAKTVGRAAQEFGVG
jgi:hypothetical protein